MPVVEIRSDDICYSCKVPAALLEIVEDFPLNYNGLDYKYYVDGEYIGMISERGLEDFEYEIGIKLRQKR